MRRSIDVISGTRKNDPFPDAPVETVEFVYCNRPF